MDLNQLALFVRVVEAGSFTAAAMRLDLPKSSVSRGIAALEQDLNVRLLQRTTRTLHLTDAGQSLYQVASHALEDIERATTCAGELQDLPRGKVRITSSEDVGRLLVAPVAARFMLQYPDIDLDVVLTPRNVDLVQEGFDLAVRVGRLADSSLVARSLGVLRIGLFASPDYLQRRGAPDTVQGLADHCCLDFRGTGRGETQWRLVGPDGLKTVAVRARLNSDSLIYLETLIASGAGIGPLPLYASAVARANAPLPRLVRVLPDYATSGEPINLVTPSARFVPKRVRLLIDMLTESIRQELENADPT
ncbi:LysR substrate-binding domain-containing protein [Ralstonia sp. VS2407]